MTVRLDARAMGQVMRGFPNEVVLAGNIIHARQAKFVAVSIMQPIPPLDELKAGLQIVITVVASAQYVQEMVDLAGAVNFDVKRRPF